MRAEILLSVTVDDLPTHGPLTTGTSRLALAERMLDTLKRHHVREAYGFVNGAQLEQDPAHVAILRRWTAAGFPLANHTYSHLDLDQVEPAAYLADIERNDRLLERLTPKGDFRIFRYPYLHDGRAPEKRRLIREALRKQGYRIAEVTVYFEDWAFAEPYERCVRKGDAQALSFLRETFLDFAVATLTWADAVATASFKRPIKHILVMHIGEFTTLMLDELLARYERQGVRYIPLREAMSDPAYDHVFASGRADDETFLMRLVSEQGSATRVKIPQLPREELEALCE